MWLLLRHPMCKRRIKRHEIESFSSGSFRNLRARRYPSRGARKPCDVIGYEGDLLPANGARSCLLRSVRGVRASSHRANPLPAAAGPRCLAISLLRICAPRLLRSSLVVSAVLGEEVVCPTT